MADANNNKSGFHIRTFSLRNKRGKGSKSSVKNRKSTAGVIQPQPPPGPVVCEAIRDFPGIEPCDLSFKVGDRITITTRTQKQFDWWEGRLRGKVGIFPANYVKLDVSALGS